MFANLIDAIRAIPAYVLEAVTAMPGDTLVAGGLVVAMVAPMVLAARKLDRG